MLNAGIGGKFGKEFLLGSPPLLNPQKDFFLSHNNIHMVIPCLRVKHFSTAKLCVCTQVNLCFDEEEVRLLLEALFVGVVKLAAGCFFGVFFASPSLLVSGRTEGGRLEF